MVGFWTRVEKIDLADFEQRRFESLDDFFLRRLRSGARPLGRGFLAPADGRLVASGRLDLRAPLVIKNQRLSVQRLVNGGLHQLDVGGYDRASFAVVFLTPRGYHRVHMPIDGEITGVQWIPGRYFPQNEDALDHIPRIYERNERAVLRCRATQGFEFLLIMVGASLIGGIELRGVRRAEWVHRAPTRLGLRRAKGEEIGHFAFGSTVVLLVPAGAVEAVPLPPELCMGQTLFALSA
jgi:phosphatidylserine decarboxylase